MQKQERMKKVNCLQFYYEVASFFVQSKELLTAPVFVLCVCVSVCVFFLFLSYNNKQGIFDFNCAIKRTYNHSPNRFSEH